MKILMMANHCDTGGITSYLLNLSRALVVRGHQVFVVCAKGGCAPLFEEIGVKVIFKDIRVKSEAHPKLWMALPSVIKLVKHEKIEIIHAQTRVTQIMAAVVSFFTAIPYLSTCHGFFKTRVFRRVFPCWGKGVIAVSRGVVEHLINDFHLTKEKVVLIPNGIDLERFNMVDEEQRRQRRSQWRVEGGFIVGIIARLSSVKGIDVLINALPEIISHFPTLRLWVVGEGPEKQRLQKLVEEKGLMDQVRFEPVVNRTPDILPIFDVFVLPSFQEGLGLSVMEAQACGIPVVASDVGGLPDLVEEGKTGLLVPPGNAHALATKIIFMLNNPIEAKRMSVAARKHIEANFSLDQMAASTYSFYEKNTRR